MKNKEDQVFPWIYPHLGFYYIYLVHYIFFSCSSCSSFTIWLFVACVDRRIDQSILAIDLHVSECIFVCLCIFFNILTWYHNWLICSTFFTNYLLIFFKHHVLYFFGPSFSSIFAIKSRKPLWFFFRSRHFYTCLRCILSKP